MATAITVAETVWIQKGVARISWVFASGTTLGQGNALSAPHLPDKTVQVFGPTGGTTSVTIQGSNDLTPTGNYVTLVDPQGTNLSFTNTAIEAILESPRFIRPDLTVATGPAVTVTIVSRSGLRG